MLGKVSVVRLQWSRSARATSLVLELTLDLKTCRRVLRRSWMSTLIRAALGRIEEVQELACWLDEPTNCACAVSLLKLRPG